MTFARLRPIVAIAGALALALAAPLAVYILLRPDGPVVVVPAIGAALALLSCARSLLPPRARGAVKALSYGCYAGAALILLVYIVVIPFTYYLAWLDLVRSGQPGGIISFLFYSVTAFFAAVFAGSVTTRRFWRAAAGLALVVVFEAAVIYQSLELAVAFTAIGILAVVLLCVTPQAPLRRRLLLPALLLAVSIAFAAVFSVGSPPNSGVLVRTGLLTDVKRLIVGIFPDLSALSSVAGYGYSFDREELGRKPVLSSVPLVRVNDGRGVGALGPVYLRTQVFDDYFNNNWGVSHLFLEGMARPTPEVGIGEGGRPGAIDVTVVFDYVPLLPHTLDTRAVSLPAGTRATVDGGGFDTGFNLATPLVKGDMISLSVFPPEAKVWMDDADERPPVNGRPENSYHARPEPGLESSPERRERYVRVPSSVTGRVRDLAASLSAGKDAPAVTVDNIIRFLERGYDYTLDTRLPPLGEEFVDDFLFVTRRGFCVHFATAFIVLARLNDIPARYATGFLAVPKSGQLEMVVTGYNAHAWPEVWLPATGWVTVEATPALNPGNSGVPDYYRAYNPDGDGLTARQLAALMGDRVPASHGDSSSAFGWLRSLIPALPWAGAAIVLGAGALAWARRARKRRAKQARYRGPLRRFNRALCVLVARLERRSVPPPETGGWSRWGRDLKRKFPARAGQVDALVATVNGVFFARRPAGKRQIAFARRLARRLKTGG